MASVIGGITLTPGNYSLVLEATPTNGVTVTQTAADYRTGVEITTVFTNTSSVSSYIAPTSFLFDLVVPSSTYPKAMTSFWLNDGQFRNRSAASHSTNGSRWAYQSMGFPGNTIYSPILVLSFNNDTSAIGFSTNYNRQMNIYGDFNAGIYRIGLNTNYQLPQGTSYLPQNDWFAPSETRTFKVWIQTAYNAAGLQTSDVMTTIAPYIEWNKGAYPNYGNSTKVNGRLCGVYLAQAEAPTTYNGQANTKRYWAFHATTHATASLSDDAFSAPYVHPETCTGWEQLLDSIFPVQTLLSKGYVGVVLWAITGYANNGDDLLQNVYTNLPNSLKNTMDQIRTWSRKTGLKVFIYCGYGGRKVQTSTTWNAASVEVASNYTMGSFNIATAVKPAIGTTNDNILKDNFDRGIFNYVDGVFLDAGPDASASEWFAATSSRWAATRKVFGQETLKSDASHALCPFTYFTESNFLGICPLLNKLSPGYQPNVILSSFTDFADNRTNFEARIRAIEEAGGCCIILGASASQLPNIPLYMTNRGGRALKPLINKKMVL